MGVDVADHVLGEVLDPLRGHHGPLGGALQFDLGCSFVPAAFLSEFDALGPKSQTPIANPTANATPTNSKFSVSSVPIEDSANIT